MLSAPLTLNIPLQADEQGALLVSGTRVTLDILIARYHQGDSPEAIHEGFETVPLNDIYAVIAYYLANQDEVDAYLARRDGEAEQRRQAFEAHSMKKQAAFRERTRLLVEQKHRGM